jgi:hypothetical protein
MSDDEKKSLLSDSTDRELTQQQLTNIHRNMLRLGQVMRNGDDRYTNIQLPPRNDEKSQEVLNREAMFIELNEKIRLERNNNKLRNRN